MSAVSKYIDSRFHSYLSGHGDIEVVEAQSLIIPQRLDLAVKKRFVKHLLSGDLDKRSEFLYKEHLKIISNGTYIEPGDQTKNSYEDYRSSLLNLIESIKLGFNSNKSLVPLSRNGIPIDGAHRIAVSAALGKKISVVRLDVDDFLYDQSFFLSRIAPSEFVDELFLTYLQETSVDTALVIEWPSGKGISNDIEDEFSDSIVYKKSLNLSYESVKNIMLMNYWGEQWLGGDAVGNIGIHNKARECFRKGNTIFYWVSGMSLEQRNNAKQKVRELNGNTKHIIHSTDSIEETQNISKSLLNENSIKMLSIIKPELCSKVISNLDVLNDLERSKYAIGGSYIMGLLGSRMPSDIDLIHEVDKLPREVGSHNEYLDLYDSTLSKALYEPENHFYYFGHKFASDNLVLNLKRNRGEPKDQLDILEINKLLGDGGTDFVKNIKKAYYTVARELLFYSVRLIKFLGLKEQVKLIIRKIKG